MSSELIICVALDCEARPFIDAYQMKKDKQSAAFALYIHQELPLALIVTGVGKVKMAAAVAYVYQYLRLDAGSCYINLGIAGSAALPLGQLIIADKIIDQATNRVYFPFINDQRFKHLASVTTYDKAVSDYPEQGLVDMEASAFFASASLFLTQEHLLCVKIVSDTPLATWHTLNKAKIIGLINDRLDLIDGFVQKIFAKFSCEDGIVAMLDHSTDAFLQRWHFTDYQKNRLKGLLRRWHVLIKKDDPLEFCCHEQSAQGVLVLLMQHLAAVDYRW